MDSQGLVKLFRKDVADETKPYLWSDDEAYGYLNDAQTTLVREIGGIADSTGPATYLKFSAEAEKVKFPKTILKVRGAYLASTGQTVRVLNFENMEREGFRFNGTVGTLRVIVIGVDEDFVYLLDRPLVADTVRLIVDRLPNETIDVTSAPQALEVEEKYHRKLLLGMKALAYDKQDAETFDKRKAEEFAAQFAKECAKAKAERERKRYKPRTVAYGGLPMGTRADLDYGRSR